MQDLLDKIGIYELIIIGTLLYGLFRKITSSRSYNDQLREETAKKEKYESNTFAPEPASEKTTLKAKEDNIK